MWLWKYLTTKISLCTVYTLIYTHMQRFVWWIKRLHVCQHCGVTKLWSIAQSICRNILNIVIWFVGIVLLAYFSLPVFAEVQSLNTFQFHQVAGRGQWRRVQVAGRAMVVWGVYDSNHGVHAEKEDLTQCVHSTIFFPRAHYMLFVYSHYSQPRAYL